MDISELRTRIQFKLDVCHGQACITGTRISVAVILDNLARGVAKQAVLNEYPSLEEADIDAALAYAAIVTREHRLASVDNVTHGVSGQILRKLAGSLLPDDVAQMTEAIERDCERIDDNMNDIQKYIEKNLEDPEFAQAWEESECGYQVTRQLIQLRMDKNLTQSEAAARAGITQSVIARIENGEQNISVRTLQKLAKALGTEIDIRLKPQR